MRLVMNAMVPYLYRAIGKIHIILAVRRMTIIRQACLWLEINLIFYRSCLI